MQVRAELAHWVTQVFPHFHSLSFNVAKLNRMFDAYGVDSPQAMEMATLCEHEVPLRGVSQPF